MDFLPHQIPGTATACRSPLSAIGQMDDSAKLASLPTYSELVEALRNLRKGPVFHCVQEDHEKHWPQIAAADALLARIPQH